MTNFMMSDPKAIAFIGSVAAVAAFDRYAEEYGTCVRYAGGTKDISEKIDNIAGRIAEECGIVASTESLTAIAFSFIRHTAEMMILTRED
jgi:hypothetical protein